MFSYFGGKATLASKYPKPKHRLIIEPFAGSAQYALRYWAHDVYLVDCDPVVIGVWKWLLTARRDDIKRLPLMQPGRLIPKVDPPAAWWFLRFCMNQGSEYPRYTAGQFRKKAWRSILRQLPNVRHWRVAEGYYTGIPNVTATWFIDPPYQHQGIRYRYNTIDYRHLAEWCQSRKGQVIVCEAEPANWLPFRPLAVTRRQGSRGSPTKATRGGKYMELIWTNDQ